MDEASRERFNAELEEIYYNTYMPNSSFSKAMLTFWIISGCAWTMTINTCKNRLFQTYNLQWAIAYVALVKVLQLSLTSLFWHSCYHKEICSLWMSFGVYITEVIFQTTYFVSFLIISHGYGTVCQNLSAPHRRKIAILGCVFYLTLVGQRASVPYFYVLLLLTYTRFFNEIFNHISKNLLMLREKLTFTGDNDKDAHAIHDAVYFKFVMFKEFQVVMKVVAVTEALIYMIMHVGSSQTSWLRFGIREFIQFFIYFHIGNTIRIQELPQDNGRDMPTIRPGETVVW